MAAQTDCWCTALDEAWDMLSMWRTGITIFRLFNNHRHHNHHHQSMEAHKTKQEKARFDAMTPYEQKAADAEERAYDVV